MAAKSPRNPMCLPRIAVRIAVAVLLAADCSRSFGAHVLAAACLRAVPADAVTVAPRSSPPRRATPEADR
jgi:hypothetical protein